MKGQGEKKEEEEEEEEEEFKKFSEKYFLVFGKCYKENQKNKHSTQIDARRSTGFDGAVLRELQSDDRAVNRDRREGEIAINGAISRSVDRDLAKHRADRDRREGEFAIDGAGACERRGLVMLLPLALSLSLSLSLSPKYN